MQFRRQTTIKQHEAQSWSPVLAHPLVSVYIALIPFTTCFDKNRNQMVCKTSVYRLGWEQVTFRSAPVPIAKLSSLSGATFFPFLSPTKLGLFPLLSSHHSGTASCCLHSTSSFSMGNGFLLDFGGQSLTQAGPSPGKQLGTCVLGKGSPFSYRACSPYNLRLIPWIRGGRGQSHIRLLTSFLEDSHVSSPQTTDHCRSVYRIS